MLKFAFSEKKKEFEKRETVSSSHSWLYKSTRDRNYSAVNNNNDTAEHTLLCNIDKGRPR